MIVTITASADYELPAPAFLVLMVEPRLAGDRHEVVHESLRTTTTRSAVLDQDVYGNPIRRFVVPEGLFSFRFVCTAKTTGSGPLEDDLVQHPVEDLPPGVLHFTLPSRYCAPERLRRMVASEFAGLETGPQKVRAVHDWVQSRIEFRYGVTNSLTTAEDTLIDREGVCRDFAHATIVLCRALDIPARFVSGYCLGLEPPDFHAWAQVYLSGAWHDIDSTVAGTRRALVPIAYGRDAADVSIATFYGPCLFCAQSVEVEESPEDEEE